jgi:hypothetical protein
MHQKTWWEPGRQIMSDYGSRTRKKEKASLHLLWHTWAGKEIERRTDNDKRRVNEYVKKGP